MRVTFVLPCSGRYPIGGFRIVYEYANRLAARGHDVTIVHFAAFPELMPLKRRLRAAVQYIRDRITGGYLPKSWFALSPRVKTRWGYAPSTGIFPEADVIVATAWQTAEIVAELPVSKGRKYYFIQHFEDWTGPEGRVRATWKLPLRKLVIARWLEEMAAEMGETTSHLPNAIDTGFFAMHQAHEARDPASILFPSHPMEWKGSADAAAAINELRAEGVSLRVSAFGHKHPSEFGLNAPYEFHRNPPQTVLRDLYNDAAIFVSASHEEGWGLPPAEAAACGAALVVSANGGHRDYLTDGETALMFQPHDIQAMKAAIRTLVEDQGRRVALARAAHDHIQSYNWTRSVEILEGLLAETDDASAQA